MGGARNDGWVALVCPANDGAMTGEKPSLTFAMTNIFEETKMHISSKTKVYGVIGYPIGHSRSPAMHNAAFRKLGLDAVYLAFEVKPKDLKKAINGIRSLGVSGINVTIPHKEKVIASLDSISREARLIGAVNTVVNKNGTLSGFNTDCFGFIKSLKEDLKLDPRKKNIFIVGAGGAAKAVAFALAINGAKRVVITDKLDDKALDLACEVELKTGCECMALKTNSEGIRDMILNSQLLVNASSCGMKSKDPVVVSPDFLHKDLHLFDLVYNRETRLVGIAKQKGLKAVGGLNMLLYQGAKALELWTGKKAPIKVMKKALLVYSR